ncbi:hypothetical protein E3E12_08255 [Formicincola oecophyllae]|uniref:Uncharacterized protein n=1 Tax=Formicincola oecophyllae TaxID=2558361 RepID=A0A4Y6UDT5_9PROT|nr:hypothetical protein [Formicincola oecophyllae]QDH14185.1 hypothetical protein E3E12_08255 [Formicincola oecophyllae]
MKRSHSPQRFHQCQDVPHSRGRGVLRAACLLLAGVGAATSLSGCMLFYHGPENYRRDRLAYDRQLSTSQKQEMLLNIVQLRYGDAPTMLETMQIIASYSYQHQVGANISGTPWNGGGPQSFIGGNGSYMLQDNPTVTYQPMSGEGFANNVLQPIPPSVILPLMQSGAPIDILLALTADSLGGAANMRAVMASNKSLYTRSTSTRFAWLLKSLHELQTDDALGVRRVLGQPATKTTPAKPEHSYLVFTNTGVPEVTALQERVKELLHLPRGATEAEIVYGRKPDGKTQLPIVTRSMLSILMDVASTIEVPEVNVKEGLTTASVTPTTAGRRPVIVIRCSTSATAPDDAYVSVRYGNAWYWISKKDMHSKSAFALLQIISGLANSTTSQGAMVTIPTGG